MRVGLTASPWPPLTHPKPQLPLEEVRVHVVEGIKDSGLDLWQAQAEQQGKQQQGVGGKEKRLLHGHDTGKEPDELPDLKLWRERRMGVGVSSQARRSKSDSSPALC